MPKGRIIAVREDGTATVVVKLDLDRYCKWRSKEVAVELLDARPLSDKQRRMCYALIGDIADFTGNNRYWEKTTQKNDFNMMRAESGELKSEADMLFSLADAPMSLIAAFQKFLVELCVEHDVPTKLPLWEYADDIDAYVFACVVRKKCVVCGKRADLHHCEKSRVGLGFNKTEVIHEGREVITLCRTHHTECHAMPEREFLNRYHFNSGVIADKSICRLYKLKAKPKGD